MKATNFVQKKQHADRNIIKSPSGRSGELISGRLCCSVLSQTPGSRAAWLPAAGCMACHSCHRRPRHPLRYRCAKRIVTAGTGACAPPAMHQTYSDIGLHPDCTCPQRKATADCATATSSKAAAGARGSAILAFLGSGRRSAWTGLRSQPSRGAGQIISKTLAR